MLMSQLDFDQIMEIRAVSNIAFTLYGKEQGIEWLRRDLRRSETDPLTSVDRVVILTAAIKTLRSDRFIPESQKEHVQLWA